ncbi:helix-turn-helix domain-containing protein [Micromonospora sp. NPDC005113]
MAISRDIARVNFARFVERALRLARQRDLTDMKIKEVTGVGPSTFHRWRRGDWGKDWPETQKVIDFCEGLGIPVEGAFDALGISGQRQPTEAPSQLDPDVRIILQRLADPSVSAAEKTMIRGTLQHLANISSMAERGDDKDRRAS